MDEDALRWFVDLCETQNMRDSAARLRVPQPTMSRGLARLEREVGTALFDRRGRTLHLNRFGALVREHAERAVEELDAARRRLAAERDPDTAVLRIGFLQSMARWLVPQVVGDYRRAVPHAQFALSYGLSRDLFDRLRADELDAAVVTPPRDEPGITWIHLAEQQLCLAVPPEHPLARAEHAEVAQLDGAAFVAFSRSTDLRHVVDELLAGADAHPVIAFESAEIDTMRGLVRAGLGVSILPRPSRLDADDPVYVPFQPRTVRQLGLAFATGTTPSPAAQRFRARFSMGS